MSDLIDTTEMYLRTVYELLEEGIVPLRARIAERLNQSGPTVSQTVARMERDGLLVVAGDRHLELTETGRAKAVTVMRKHRLAELLLVDVVGLEWQYVHAEACRWEHVISDHVEARLLTILENPSTSPFGTPVPPVDVDPASFDPSAIFLAGVASLRSRLEAGAVPAQGADLVVRRFGELIQSDVDLLAELSGAGIGPGTTVRIVPDDQGDASLIGSKSQHPVVLDPVRLSAIFVDV